MYNRLPLHIPREGGMQGAVVTGMIKLYPLNVIHIIIEKENNNGKNFNALEWRARKMCHSIFQDNVEEENVNKHEWMNFMQQQ